MSKWAQKHIETLKSGKVATFKPKGLSMEPIIMSGQKVQVSPISGRIPKVGDVVLCKVGRNHFLHKVVDFNKSTNQYKIGNNNGFVNGNIGITNIFGVVTWKEEILND